MTIVDPTDAKLAQLVAVIDHHYRLAVISRQSMIEHAIACGEALIEAKNLVPPGQWSRWLEDNLPDEVRRSMSRNYMRLAYLKEHVDSEASITTNLQAVRGLPHRSAASPRKPPELKEEALQRRAGGEAIKAIARDLEVNPDTVRAWVDPNWKDLKNERMRRIRRKRPASTVVVQNQVARAYKYGTPGRAATVRAVKRLAQVQSPKQVREALRDLIAVCEAWLDQLDGRTHPDLRRDSRTL